MAWSADGVKNSLTSDGSAPVGSAPPSATAPKSAWRMWARSQRSALDIAALSAALVEHVSAWLAARAPTTVLLYRAMAGELDLDELAERPGPHRWATTRTPDRGPLSVHPWDSPLETHRFGFRQPVASAPELEGSSIGVVLVPGLVFDRHGGRIGYGQGYYDRLLHGLAGAQLLAITCRALVVDRLPSEPHDVAMHRLATENGVFDAVV